MNNKVAVFSAFVLGALAGAGSVFTYTKSKYIKKDIYEKEISSAREEYAKMQDDLLKEKKELEDEKKHLAEKNTLEKARIMDDYRKGISSFGYVEEVLGKANENVVSKPIEEVVPKDIPELKEEVVQEPIEEDIYDEEKIYLIGEEDFDEIGYDIRDLTLYDNGIVTDEVGEVIEHPEDILGNSMMEILPSYSSGWKEAYVRNDNLKIDFDIELAGTDFFEG